MIDLVGLQQRAGGHEVEVWGMQHDENDSPLTLEDTFAPFVELEPPPGGVSALRASARMVWSRSSRRNFETALRRFRPDVVHCHNIYHQLSPSILASVRELGLPCVMTLHDYKLACPSYQMLDHGRLCQLCVTGGTWHAAKQRCKSDSFVASSLLAVESGVHRATAAYAPVDVFISPSRFLAEVISRSGVSADRLRVVSHFVDLDDVPQSKGMGTRIVFAGRLSAEKGVDTLIEAMASLPADVHLDIAGDGPVRAQLERQAADLAPGRVNFHGRLATSALRPLVANALASVVPSRWYENQPLSILESFAAAVPVVATDLGGMPELVRAEVDGLVVPHDDPSALARALLRLMDDRAWAHRLGVTARARLEEEFSASAHLAAISEVYRYASSPRGGVCAKQKRSL